MSVAMTPVQSSNIQAVGYDPATSTIQVQFMSGSTFSYAGVPQETYDGLMASASKGKFFFNEIKGKYAGQKLETAT